MFIVALILVDLLEINLIKTLPILSITEVCEDMYDHPRSIRCLNNEPVYDELRY